MNGRTALITGASRGIGTAIAKRFCEAGARLLTPSRAEMDLADIASVEAYMSALRENVDILVNNAGINVLGGISEIRDHDLAAILRTNLESPLRLARAVAAGMVERGYGRILNISSIWGTVSRERRVVYGVSKAGLDGLTRALAVELGPSGVLVNSLAPGYIFTEMTTGNNTPEELAAIRNGIPLRRFGEPEDVAEVAAFLCSSRNTYITGQTIIADGGYTAL